MGVIRKVNRGDRIRINSDAKNVSARITIPRRRPLMFSISTNKDLDLSVKT